MSQLTPFAPGLIWTIDAPCRFFGIEIGARMTVVRLSSGELWVHSPLDVQETVRRQITALGPVRYLVAPSRFHYREVAAFHRHYPEAEVFGTPHVIRAHPKVGFTGALTDAPPPAWAADLDQIAVQGHMFLDERVFLHRASRTLIVADLILSAHADSAWSFRLVSKLTGLFDRPGPPPDMRLTFRDRPAARASIRRILAWDFDRIVLSHGHLIPPGGKEVLQRAYAFLLKSN
jgi:hypothetical protein